MKTATINLIAVLVRQLIGSDLWGLIVIAVTQQNEADKTGEEKRQAVISAVQAFAKTAAGWLINLAIETAVAKLKVTK